MSNRFKAKRSNTIYKKLIHPCSGHLFYLISSILSPIPILLYSLQAIRLKNDELLVIINMLGLVVPYISAFQLGTLNGLVAIVHQKISKSQQIVSNDHVETANAISSYQAIAMVICTLLFLWINSVAHFTQLSNFSIILIGLSLGVSVRNQFYEASARAFGEFQQIATSQLAISVATLIAVFAMEIYAEASKTLRVIVAPLLGMVIYHLICQPKVAQLKYKALKELLAIGFPMFLSSIIFSYIIIIDRTLITIKMGSDAVVSYSLFNQITAIQMGFINPLAALFVSRISQEVAASNQKKPLIRRYFTIGLITNFLLLAGSSLIINLIPVNMYVSVLNVSEYSIKIVKLGSILNVSLLFVGPSSLLVVLQKTNMALFFSAFGLLAGWLFGVFSMRMCRTIEMALTARTVGCLVTGGLTVWYVNKTINKYV